MFFDNKGHRHVTDIILVQNKEDNYLTVIYRIPNQSLKTDLFFNVEKALSSTKNADNIDTYFGIIRNPIKMYGYRDEVVAESILTIRQNVDEALTLIKNMYPNIHINIEKVSEETDNKESENATFRSRPL